MVSYFRFVLRHRFTVLAILLAITVVAGFAMTRGEIGSSLGKLFLGDSPDYRRYNELTEAFGSDELFVVAYEDPDVLSTESLQRLQRAVRALDEMPEVDRTQSILDARRVFRTGEENFIDSFVERAGREADLKARLLEDLTSDELIRGTVVSRDGKHGAVIITLASSTDRAVENNIDLVDRMLATFVDAGYDPEKLHRAGAIAVVAEMISQTYFNVRRLFPFVCLLLIVTVFVIFRRLWPVVVSMSVAIIAVTWTMGVAITIDTEVNILLAAVPAIVLIISFSDVIHICSAYLLELADERTDKNEAILRSASDVGTACVFTSATTCVGFVCISLIPTPVFRQLGLILGIGVGFALLIAMTLVPILFSLMRTPREWRTGVASSSQNAIDGLLRCCERWSGSRPRTVIIAFALLLGVSVYGALQIEIENELSKRLAEDNPVRRDSDYFLEHFAGTNVLDVYLTASGEGDVFAPDLLARIGKFQDSVEEIEVVDLVLSPVTVLRAIHTRATGAEELIRVLPADGAEIEQYLTALKFFDSEALDSLVDPQRHTMRLIVRLHEKGLRATYRTGRATQSLARTHLGDSARIETTGMAFLIGGWLDKVLDGQRRGLLISFVTIGIMMIIALRSLGAGLWSMVPNLLPLLVLGGYVGLAWGQVDSDIFGVAMLAIGIGVDDTIHFLIRFRIESSREADRSVALAKAFHYAGRGIVITTLILTIGFLPFALSDYFSLRILGTLLPLVLIAALLADVLLVPALGQVGLIRFDRSKRVKPRAGGSVASLLLWGSLALGGIALFGGTAQAEEPPRTGECAAGLESFEELMVSFTAKHEIPGASLTVLRHGKLVLARGYGWADREAKRRVEPTSLFRIASLSKPITAVAILRLVEAGKLGLDSRIDALLAPHAHLAPDANPDPRLAKITIRQLLQHTGGFDRAASFDPMFRSLDIAKTLGKRAPAETGDVIRYMWGRPLDFDPGTRYAYSNFGYCLLGRAIEKASGLSYEEYTRRHVLSPLGITRARIGRTLRNQRLTDEVTYYPPAGSKSVAVVGEIGRTVSTPYGAWYHESLDAHGGWVASAVDLARFVRAFEATSEPAPLKPSSVETMFSRPPGAAGLDGDGRPAAYYYACGWMVRPKPENGSENRWHTGSLPGTSTLMVRRHDGLAWVVLFNKREGKKTRHVASAIDRQLHVAANRVKIWPDIDLFTRYR